MRLEVEVTVFEHNFKMSEGVYENTDGFKDNKSNAMKNTDIDDQLYGNVGAFKPSPRDGVVASGKIA